jgi:hypothetical protein
MKNDQVVVVYRRLFQKSKSINRKARKGLALSPQSIIRLHHNFASFANPLRALRFKRPFETASCQR